MRRAGERMNSESLTIDVVSDVVCPWCYIGKRRLETALAALMAQAPALVPQVRWHPFQLNPDLPPEGIERARYLEAKFGGAARADAIYARVREAASQSGVTLALDAITRQPNTLAAHRLIMWTQGQRGDASSLVERLFRAYFVEGRLIGDPATLAELAADAGGDAAAVRAFLASDQLRDDVADADERARALGISGVPFFVFNGRVALSGAHEPETLLDAIAQARKAEATEPVA
jgi:predicted DsbA family dithiol-disulfide isomerase